MTEHKEERIPIVGMRKKIYKNLVQSAFTIPHATGMEVLFNRHCILTLAPVDRRHECQPKGI